MIALSNLVAGGVVLPTVMPTNVSAKCTGSAFSRWTTEDVESKQLLHVFGQLLHGFGSFVVASKLNLSQLNLYRSLMPFVICLIHCK